MKTYSVKQIAEMLSTNPETVRRWIRDDKLKAVQVSRKDGNVVSEAELERFLKATPKYLSKLAPGVGLLVASPVVGVGVLAGGVVASALLGYFEGKNSSDIRVRPEDFTAYLQESILKLNKTIAQKRELILQTQTEISELLKQVQQYQYLLEHEDLLAENLEKATSNMKE